MKKYLFLAAAAMTAVSCTQSSVSEDAVREFATSHIENQVGYEAAVEGYYEGATSDLKVWSNPVWKNVCLLYTSPSPRDRQKCRMPSSA